MNSEEALRTTAAGPCGLQALVRTLCLVGIVLPTLWTLNQYFHFFRQAPFPYLALVGLAAAAFLTWLALRRKSATLRWLLFSP